MSNIFLELLSRFEEKVTGERGSGGKGERKNVRSMTTCELCGEPNGEGDGGDGTVCWGCPNDHSSAGASSDGWHQVEGTAEAEFSWRYADGLEDGTVVSEKKR